MFLIYKSTTINKYEIHQDIWTFLGEGEKKKEVGKRVTAGWREEKAAN